MRRYYAKGGEVKDACYKKVKSQYKVFPSAYASGAIAKCRKEKGAKKTEKGSDLKRWFKEDWKDVRTGKACGRGKGEKRGTPYCRPSKRVSAKTPKTSGEMTTAEKRSRISQKKSLGQPAGKPKRVASLKRRK